LIPAYFTRRAQHNKDVVESISSQSSPPHHWAERI
jgi:hypothetical protein